MIYRTVALEENLDLNNICRGDGFLFVKDGVGHAGRGVFFSGTSDNVFAQLRTIGGWGLLG